MGLSRHVVAAQRLAAATEDFPARLSRQVGHQQQAERLSTSWSTVATDLLDYAGARSVGRPELDRDTWLAVYSAAEAYLAVVTVDGYSPHRPARVFLSYANSGVSYPDLPPEAQRGTTTTLAADDWMSALCLVVIVGAQCTNAVTLLETVTATSLSPVEQAFAGYALGQPANGQTTPDDDSHQSLLELLDRDRTGNDSEFTRAVRALVIRDRDAFWPAVERMLATQRDAHGADSPPRSLLPLRPIALAALAARNEGWDPAVTSDYLPGRLVTGRVTGELAAPSPTRPAHLDRPRLQVSTAQLRSYDEGTCVDLEHALRNPRVRPHSVPQALVRTMEAQLHRFRLRSARDPRGRDPRQREAVTIASQSGAALFRVATSPGDDVDVTIGHVNAPLWGTGPTPETNESNWCQAVCAALLADDAGALDVLVNLDLGHFVADDTPEAVRYYHEALHTYLRGADATAATELAVWARERAAADKPDVLLPPAGLLSRLVTGDADAFALCLVEALEGHRDHFTVGDNADDPTQLVNLDVLALAHHATAKGWPVPVRSDYLPETFLTH